MAKYPGSFFETGESGMDSIVNLASIPNLVPLLHSPHFLRELAFIDDLLRRLVSVG